MKIVCGFSVSGCTVIRANTLGLPCNAYMLLLFTIVCSVLNVKCVMFVVRDKHIHKITMINGKTMVCNTFQSFYTTSNILKPIHRTEVQNKVFNGEHGIHIIYSSFIEKPVTLSSLSDNWYKCIFKCAFYFN